MKSLNNRLEKIEQQSLTTDKCVGNSLKELYDWEQTEEGKAELDAFYDENIEAPKS